MEKPATRSGIHRPKQFASPSTVLDTESSRPTGLMESQAKQHLAEIEQLRAEAARLKQREGLLLELLEIHARERQLAAYEIHDGLANAQRCRLPVGKLPGSSNGTTGRR